jgi:hypothetical protein
MEEAGKKSFPGQESDFRAATRKSQMQKSVSVFLCPALVCHCNSGQIDPLVLFTAFERDLHKEIWRRATGLTGLWLATSDPS